MTLLNAEFLSSTCYNNGRNGNDDEKGLSREFWRCYFDDEKNRRA